jgi:lipoprotein NlpD
MPSQRLLSRLLQLGLLAVTGWVLSGCNTPPNKAPIEDRKPAKPAAKTPAAAASAAMPAEPVLPVVAPAEVPKALPGAENAGKPGYYTVKPGDTLIRIGLDNGQNWRDVVRWNGIENPNLIEVGQVLRVVPPNVDASAVKASGVSAAKIEARPLDGKPAAAPAGAASAPAAPAAPAARPAEDDVGWIWPATGPMAGKFDEGKNNGIEITGKLGDSVVAAADGRVMYVGADLRGLGNLVIIKHNNTYLTAYANNKTLLVKEDQVVRKGQKIAEMGSSDAERVQLHFEIRKLGKPIDPLRLLPSR